MNTMIKIAEFSLKKKCIAEIWSNTRTEEITQVHLRILETSLKPQSKDLTEETEYIHHIYNTTILKNYIS